MQPEDFQDSLLPRDAASSAGELPDRVLRGLPDDVEIRSTVWLLHQYRLGKEAAFTQLYERHEASVRRSIAIRLGCRLRDLIDVDDILQETYLAAWQYVVDGCFQAFQSVGSFRNMLVKIATQKLLDEAKAQGRLRRDRRRTVPLGDAGHEQPSPHPRPSQLARGREVQELVEEAMLRLSEADRWVLDCRRNLCMSYEAIAAELGCKPANAKLKYFRANERLAKQLGRLDG